MKNLEFPLNAIIIYITHSTEYLIVQYRTLNMNMATGGRDLEFISVFSRQHYEDYSWNKKKIGWSYQVDTDLNLISESKWWRYCTVAISGMHNALSKKENVSLALIFMTKMWRCQSFKNKCRSGMTSLEGERFHGFCF